MNKEQERKQRLKTTGKWFQYSKKDKTIYLIYIFPVLLILSFLFYIINL
jgi:hypothetical protein